MQSSAVRHNIRDIVTSIIGDEEQELQDETKIVEDLGCDQLDINQVFSQIEQTLEISIADDDAAKVRTMGQLIELVDSKVNP